MNRCFNNPITTKNSVCGGNPDRGDNEREVVKAPTGETGGSVLEVRGRNSTGFVSSGGVPAELIRPSRGWAPEGHHFGVHIQSPASVGLQLESSFCLAYMDAPVSFSSLNCVQRGFANCLPSLETFSGSASWKRDFKKIDVVADINASNPLVWLSGSCDSALGPQNIATNRN